MVSFYQERSIGREGLATAMLLLTGAPLLSRISTWLGGLQTVQVEKLGLERNCGPSGRIFLMKAVFPSSNWNCMSNTAPYHPVQTVGQEEVHWLYCIEVEQKLLFHLVFSQSRGFFQMIFSTLGKGEYGDLIRLKY